MTKASIISRLVNAVRDGTLPYKAACRITRTSYSPPPHIRVAEVLADIFPGNAWRSFSPVARRIWIDLHVALDPVDIRHVVHVGAHTGEFSLAFNEAFPGRQLYLLEPAPQTYATLLKNVGGFENIHCLNVAAGAEDGTATLHVDEYSPANSLLPYTKAALQEFPFLGKQTSCQVRIRPLDSALQEWGAPFPELLVLDAQGYENNILRGAPLTLETCRVVMCELSLRPLYAESSTFESVYETLTARGFRLRHLVNPVEGRSLQVLQIDGIFIRES